VSHFEAITIVRSDKATVRISRSSEMSYERCDVCEAQIEKGDIILAFSASDGVTEYCHSGGCSSEFYDPSDNSKQIGLEKTLIAQATGIMRQDSSS